MKYTVITKNIIIISDFFTSEHATKFINHFFDTPFERKISSEYQTWAYMLGQEDFSELKKCLDMELLSKIVSRVYSIHSSPSSIGEIVKMEPGDFLRPHTDAFHSLQCVAYLNSLGENEGGKLCIEDEEKTHTFVPRVGTLIIFRGTCRHSVTEVGGKTPRYVCTFGWK